MRTLDVSQSAALAAGGPEVDLTGVAEHWVCLFEGRTGAKAKAVFASEEEAKEFVVRHVRLTSPGMPLKWQDTAEPMLTTPIATYRIVCTDE